MRSVEEIIEKEKKFRNNVIPLQPSENIMPKKALEALYRKSAEGRRKISLYPSGMGRV